MYGFIVSFSCRFAAIETMKIARYGHFHNRGDRTLKVKKADTFIGLGLFLFGILTWIVAGYQATGFTYMGISPGFFPRLLSGLISFLALILMIQGMRRKKDDEFEFDRKAMKRVLVVAAMAFVYVFVMQYIGYIISTMLFLFLVLKYYGVSTKVTVIITVVLPFLVYYTFTEVMYVVVPVGSVIETIIY